jgi:hypothetical protein
MLECIVIKFFNEVIFKETDCPSQRGLLNTYTRIYQMYCSQSQRICLFIYFFLFFFWIWIIAVSPPISGRSPFWLPWLGAITYLLPMTFKVLDFPILWLWEQYIWYIRVYVLDNPLWLGQSVSLNITSLKNLITIHSSIPWSGIAYAIFPSHISIKLKENLWFI